jgi:CRISPR-associated endoribonuclease Cas6
LTKRGTETRLRLQLETVTGSLKVPVHYNQLLQGLVYDHLSRSLADRVHTQGFKHEKRQFRMFTFSRLVGHSRLIRGDSQRPDIEFAGPVSFWLASPETEILESFASHIVREGRLRLGDTECHATAVEVPFTKIPGNQVTVRTLSPITVYSTLMTADGRKKTYYYSPREREFSEQIAANLTKKSAALRRDSNHSSGSISFTPVRVSTKDQHVVYFKDTVIKAWSGIYELKAPPDLLRLAFDCGLGAKNSQGFGMIEKAEG